MYTVKTDRFEGPFDLLVYLVESARMDIYEIKIGEITEQYLEYIRLMDEQNIEVGEEFIVLAAALIKLKSQMLLPQSEADSISVDEHDFQAELSEKLSEYMKVRRIAKMLEEREERFLHIHEKPAEDLSKYLDFPDEILNADIGTFVNAFNKFLEQRKRVNVVKERYQNVKRQRMSLDERIDFMCARFEEKISVEDQVSFDELLPENPDRYDVTLSFLSLLEMMKEFDIDAFQAETYGRIMVTKREVTDVQ